MLDWGRGKYELTASQLAPIADLVIDAVEPVNGRRLLDIACGTGNAALEAARRGARGVGLDAAPRLLAVAGTRARQEDLDLDWIEADMTELPFDEDSFEIVTSVFGTIFGDPELVAAEIGRVLAPTGRMAITSWEPTGTMERIRRLIAEHVAAAVGGEAAGGASPTGEEGNNPFNWGSTDDLRELFADHGLVVQCEAHRLSFETASPEDQNQIWFDHQPMFLGLREILGPDGYEALRDETLAVLHAENEDPAAMRFTSSYLVTSGSPV
ncbi:MAG: methyltransferase domain-containing protein [Solirubrobacterales bacterium]|nr:methyltransferase domain-containing protein [Solirubrobacterales bacterium]